MKRTKKLLAILLSLLLIAGSAAISFAEGGTDGNITWSYDEETKVLTISGTGEMPEHSSVSEFGWFLLAYETVVIEDGVTSIANQAFAWSYELQNISIPSSVTSIGQHAFWDCTALESIVLPEGLETVQSYTFSGCTALKNVTIPASVTSIEGYAFNGCTALESIVLPEGLETVQSYTFSDCTALKNVTIPASVTSIEGYAFNGCTALESIVLPEGLETVQSYTFSDCTALKNVTIPASVTSIEGYVFNGCTALEAINYAGSEDDWNSVLVDDYAFEGVDLSAIQLHFAADSTPDDPTPEDPTSDDHNSSSASGSVCPVCGAEKHEIEWIGILHQVFYAVKCLFNNVLQPIFKGIKK